ncbi:MAG: hypothetical protein ACK4K8_06445 [Pannonibacter sp.]
MRDTNIWHKLKFAKRSLKLVAETRRNRLPPDCTRWWAPPKTDQRDKSNYKKMELFKFAQPRVCHFVFGLVSMSENHEFRATVINIFPCLSNKILFLDKRCH